MAKKKSPKKKPSARKAAPKRAKKRAPAKSAKKSPAKKAPKPKKAAVPAMRSDNADASCCNTGSCGSKGGLAFVGCMFLGMGLGSMAGSPGAGTLLGMGAGFLVMKKCNSGCCD